MKDNEPLDLLCVAAWREATDSYRREREQMPDDGVPLRFDLIVAEGDRLARHFATVLETLKVTALMLQWEAQTHEESGDEKRRSYVPSLRAQVAKSHDVIMRASPAERA